MAVVGFRLLRRSKRGPKTHQDGPKTSSRDFGGSFQEWVRGGREPPLVNFRTLVPVKATLRWRRLDSLRTKAYMLSDEVCRS